MPLACQHDKLLSRMNNFTPAELRKLRSLKTPYGIQRLLDDMPYHLEDTAWSPRRVLRENSSHCCEGAIFAAAALRVNGFPPLLLDFEADHDTDHVLAVYRINGHWGTVAKSNYSGCRYRETVCTRQSNPLLSGGSHAGRPIAIMSKVSHLSESPHHRCGRSLLKKHWRLENLRTLVLE